MDIRKRNIALIGHSYVRRNADFMKDDGRRSNLGLSPRMNRVRSCYVNGGKFAGPNLESVLTDPFAVRADVVYVHIGENDFDPEKDAVFAARQLYGKLVANLGRARRLILCELFHFPKHPKAWSEDINVELRRLVTAGTPRIRLWRHKAVLRTKKAFGRDGTHLRRRLQKVYWEGVRYAVLSA